ncbi:MAG: hypothetical protein M0C28_15230 [Candidatus Moduliflexus flocculans]|nr:hypothetical protein [Candidatus Moduliflexus flocculans]
MPAARTQKGFRGITCSPTARRALRRTDLLGRRGSAAANEANLYTRNSWSSSCPSTTPPSARASVELEFR